MNIFKISDEYNTLLEQIFQQGGEITEDQEQLLELNESNLKTKSSNYVGMIKTTESNIKTIDEEIKRLQQYKKTCKTLTEKLKGNLKYTMLKLGFEKLENGLNKVLLRKSQRVEISEIERIPSRYIIIEKKVDKKLLKEDLKKGVKIYGAELKDNKNINIK